MSPAAIAPSLCLTFFGFSAALKAAPGDILWQFVADDIVYASPTVAADGTVVFGSHDGVVYALNPDGSLRWMFDEALDWIEATATITPEGLVLVGSWNNTLYALDLATGELQWSFATESYLLASPALHPSGWIIQASADGSVYALTPEGQLVWQFPDAESGVTYGAWECSPAIAEDGSIFLGSTEGELIALDGWGNLLWSFDAPAGEDGDNAFHASPAIGADGTVYIGNRNTLLYAFEAEGDLDWSFAAAESIDSSPALAPDGTVYFGARDGYLYALDSSGIQQWELLIGDIFYASPVVDANGTIYLGSYTGDGVSQLTAVTAEGEAVWGHAFEGFNDSSPLITPEGNVLMGAHNGSLYALEAGGVPMAESPWPMFRQDLARDGAVSSWVLDDSVADWVTTLFPEAESGGDGWFEARWFGNGWFNAETYPWILHLDHGWLFVAGPGDFSHWFFDSQLGWLYATPLLPNYYYVLNLEEWVLHQKGSSVLATGENAGRWFYSFALEEWQLLPPG